MTSSLAKTITLVVLLVVLRPGTAQKQRQAEFDKQRLEVVEDLSESLANDLLEMSVEVGSWMMLLFIAMNDVDGTVGTHYC